MCWKYERPHLYLHTKERGSKCSRENVHTNWKQARLPVPLSKSLPTIVYYTLQGPISYGFNNLLTQCHQWGNQVMKYLSLQESTQKFQYICITYMCLLIMPFVFNTAEELFSLSETDSSWCNFAHASVHHEQSLLGNSHFRS